MSDVIARSQKVFDEAINPFLNRDKGWAEIEEFDKDTGILTVRMRGACRGCLAASEEVEGFISSAVSAVVEEVKSVELSDRPDEELMSLAKKILNHEIKLG